jgi:YafQ family addiction module toxin component
MTFSYTLKPSLQKKIDKIASKDSKHLNLIIKKIEEICANPLRYKSLKYALKGLKRAHVNKHFVLIFEIKQNNVDFIDYHHHDYIYKRFK